MLSFGAKEVIYSAHVAVFRLAAFFFLRVFALESSRTGSLSQWLFFSLSLVVLCLFGTSVLDAFRLGSDSSQVSTSLRLVLRNLIFFSATVGENPISLFFSFRAPVTVYFFLSFPFLPKYRRWRLSCDGVQSPPGPPPESRGFLPPCSFDAESVPSGCLRF